MDPKNFTTTIVVDQSPAEVFNAINNVRGWWSKELEGRSEKLNDEFTYHYKDVHRCKMKLIEVDPGKKVIWLVLDNYFSFTNDKSEWTGTKLSLTSRSRMVRQHSALRTRVWFPNMNVTRPV